MILAFLLGSLGQTDAGSCPSDQDALMQIRASVMTNATDRDGTCESLVQSVYSSVQVGGGPFAVAVAGREGPNADEELFTMCGRAEGRQTDKAPGFCQCQALSTGRQGFYQFGRVNEFPTPVTPPDWSKITPSQPASSAERCFRSGQNDPDLVTPTGFDFSCQDPTGKTDRDPHRSCKFNHGRNFPPRHLQEVPPNTQVVGLCVQQVDNPNGVTGLRTHNSTCAMVTPALCSSSVRTGRMEVAADYYNPEPCKCCRSLLK